MFCFLGVVQKKEPFFRNDPCLFYMLGQKYVNF
jgi:hypothetical protein